MASQTISKICSAHGCSSPAQHLHKCFKHYQQAYRRNLPQCAVQGCDKYRTSKNGKWCSAHLRRLRLHGDVHITLTNCGVGNTFNERFWSRVDKNGSLHPHDINLGRCWVWQGCFDSNGYGLIGHAIQTLRPVHRYAFFLCVGRIPQSHLLHSCDNPPCCNPAHLREGTQAENIADMHAKKRDAHGMRHPHHKLTDQDVHNIKVALRNGARGAELARQYHVGSPCISSIKTGKRWKHIKV